MCCVAVELHPWLDLLGGFQHESDLEFTAIPPPLMELCPSCCRLLSAGGVSQASRPASATAMPRAAGAARHRSTQETTASLAGEGDGAGDATFMVEVCRGCRDRSRLRNRCTVSGADQETVWMVC